MQVGLGKNLEITIFLKFISNGVCGTNECFLPLNCDEKIFLIIFHLFRMKKGHLMSGQKLENLTTVLIRAFFIFFFQTSKKLIRPYDLRYNEVDKPKGPPYVIDRPGALSFNAGPLRFVCF